MTHLAPRTLERLVAVDLPPGEHERAESHVAACPECAATLASLRAEQAALLVEVPAERFVMQVQARKARTRHRGWLVAPALVAAAAVLVFFVYPGGGVRTKGRTLSVIVEREGHAHELGADERVLAGDRLQLSLAGAGTVGVWFVDATGRVDRLTDAPLVLGTTLTPLPQSAVIESPCVDGKIVVAPGSPSDGELRDPRGDALVRTLRCR